MMQVNLQTDQVKNILILEDSEIRLNWFRIKLANITFVDITSVAREALRLIRKKKYDLIFLDHDLDDQVYVDSHQELDEINWNTGYQVIKAMDDTPNKDTFVIVHSLNPVGAKNMLNARPENTVWVPFLTLKQVLTVNNGTH